MAACADASLLDLEGLTRRAIAKELFSEEQRARRPFRLRIELRDCRVEPPGALPEPPPRANVEFLGG